MTIAFALVLAASLAAAVTDLRTRRIPNAIPIALAIAGIAWSARDGWQSALAFVAIAICCTLAGLVLFSLKLLGGGDVKLLAAACATLGIRESLPFLLATMLCGGAIGVAVAAREGRLRATFANVAATALPVLSGARLQPIAGGLKMPYGLAIFAGAAIAACWHFARPL